MKRAATARGVGDQHGVSPTRSGAVQDGDGAQAWLLAHTSPRGSPTLPRAARASASAATATAAVEQQMIGRVCRCKLRFHTHVLQRAALRSTRSE